MQQYVHLLSISRALPLTACPRSICLRSKETCDLPKPRPKSNIGLTPAAKLVSHPTRPLTQNEIIASGRVLVKSPFLANLHLTFPRELCVAPWLVWSFF